MNLLILSLMLAVLIGIKRLNQTLRSISNMFEEIKASLEEGGQNLAVIAENVTKIGDATNNVAGDISAMAEKIQELELATLTKEQLNELKDLAATNASNSKAAADAVQAAAQSLQTLADQQ